MRGGETFLSYVAGQNQGIGHPLLYLGDTLSADPGIGCGANVQNGADEAIITRYEAVLQAAVEGRSGR